MLGRRECMFVETLHKYIDKADFMIKLADRDSDSGKSGTYVSRLLEHLRDHQLKVLSTPFTSYALVVYCCILGR